MKRVNSNKHLYKNLLLITSRHYAEIITKLLISRNNDISILNFVHPNQLNDLPDEFLLSSRLISFGSRYYIPGSILDRIGYGSYNLHPGPVDYPGWAPFYYAIYDQATRYGIVFHEMTSKIDSGDIVATRDFDIPPQSTTQSLVNLTEFHMLELLKELGQAIVQDAYLPTGTKSWARAPLTKKDFVSICHIPLDIDERELKRRIFAFGDSDGAIFPFLYHENQKYRLAFDTDHPDRHSYWLHGHRFVLD